VANSTTLVADLTTVATNGPSAQTQANATNATALSASGGTGNMTGTTGNYATGTYYGGQLDYPGMVQLAITKSKELAVIITKLLVNTDHATDSTNGGLLANILNDLQ
jgi:hypothetical protein